MILSIFLFWGLLYIANLRRAGYSFLVPWDHYLCGFSNGEYTKTLLDEF